MFFQFQLKKCAINIGFILIITLSCQVFGERFFLKLLPTTISTRIIENEAISKSTFSNVGSFHYSFSSPAAVQIASSISFFPTIGFPVFLSKVSQVLIRHQSVKFRNLHAFVLEWPSKYFLSIFGYIH